MGKTIRVLAVDPSDIRTGDVAIEMPERFRLEIVYFMTPNDRPGAPSLGANEYWIEPENVERWLDDGCFSVVSPLDAEAVAEIELTEEQERWLEWLKRNKITRVRLERTDA